MKRKVVVRKTVHRGTLHPDFCQDAVASYEDDNYIYIGVFDGCSDGINSHFASEFFAKLFLKHVKQPLAKYLMFSVELLIERIAADLTTFMEEHNIIDREMLSTMIFAIFDKKECNGIAVLIGDGFVMHDNLDNGKYSFDIFEVDQNNIPDYLTYNRRQQANIILQQHADYIILYRDTLDLSICTDGIKTFFKKTVDDNGNVSVDKNVFDEVVDVYCKDRFLIDSEAMLSRKHRMLENKGYGHQDDFSIVRIMVVDEEEPSESDIQE